MPSADFDYIQFEESDQTILFRLDCLDCDAKVNGGIVALPESCSRDYDIKNPKRIQMRLQYWFNEQNDSTKDPGA